METFRKAVTANGDQFIPKAFADQCEQTEKDDQAKPVGEKERVFEKYGIKSIAPETYYAHESKVSGQAVVSYSTTKPEEKQAPTAAQDPINRLADMLGQALANQQAPAQPSGLKKVEKRNAKAGAAQTVQTSETANDNAAKAGPTIDPTTDKPQGNANGEVAAQGAQGTPPPATGDQANIAADAAK